MYNSHSYKIKQFLALGIKLFIVIGCGYFIWLKLTSNSAFSFSEFCLNLIKNDNFKAKNIVTLLLFSILNHYFEILKWQNLVFHIKKISFLTATKQSLASLTASLTTPNRIGEYGAKALYYKKQYRKQVVGLNLVGNFYQLLTTLFFGCIGFILFSKEQSIHIYSYAIFKIIVFLVIVGVFFFVVIKKYSYRIKYLQKTTHFLSKISVKLHLKIAMLSCIRFFIFVNQFYFLLFIFKVDISYYMAIIAIVSIYLIASIIPMLSIFDVVLKGTVAIWIFSFLSLNANTVLTITTLMWLFNFVIPAIIGSYFVLQFNTNFKV